MVDTATLSFGFAVLASIMLVVFMAVVLFFTLAPLVSEEWDRQLSATGGPSLEGESTDAE